MIKAAGNRRIRQGIVNLHDAFLNASLQYDRMKTSPVVTNRRTFDAGDRVRFERSSLLVAGR